MMRAASDGLLPREDGIPSDKIKDQNFREIAKGLDPEDERAKALMMALVRVSPASCASFGCPVRVGSFLVD
jgi:hypothetical protein